MKPLTFQCPRYLQEAPPALVREDAVGAERAHTQRTLLLEDDGALEKRPTGL